MYQFHCDVSLVATQLRFDTLQASLTACVTMAAKKRKQGGNAKAKKKAKVTKVVDTQERAEKTPQETQENETNMEQVQDDVASSEASGLLSAELLEEMGGQDAGGALVLPGRREKKQKAEKMPEELLEQAQHMSKSKRKKLDAIAARKVKEARRTDLYKSLEKQQLSQDQMKLLYSTSQMGHKETLRERLKRSLNRQKAGIELSEDAKSELFKKKDRREEDEDEPMEEKSAKKTAQSAGAEVIKDDKPSTNDAVQDNTGKKKRRKKKASIVSRSVPMLETQEEVQVPESSAAASVMAVQQTEENPEEEAKRTSSQSAAMTKLEALRKKNEEKRRLRALTAANPKPAETPKQVEEPTLNPADVYVPKPIVMKTPEEMHELSKKTKLSYKTTLVTLSRKPEIQMARMQLPVCSSEQEIMEAITDNDVIILCGETGSGKTTQVPQFLYEAGYGHPDHPSNSGRIGVTQPRRVAAVSTAKRVAEELNVPFGAPKGHVGYQIRYDAEHVSEHTRIKFMTDGILLKEIQQDFLLRQYSILLLDEAHERNVNTDILIGLLSRIAPLRAQMSREEEEAYQSLSEEEKETADKPIKPLKLVIMSATLRVEDFTQNQRLFPNPPPVLRVDARQYPVTVHFNKRTELDNYVDEAYKKVIKIHKKLPEGGVLVFLTGQREILQLCRKLSRAYSVAARDKKAAELKSSRAFRAQRRQPTEKSSKDDFLREHDDIEEEADLEDAQVYGNEVDEDPANDLEEEEQNSDQEDDEEMNEELAVPYLHVLPLYSLLPNDEQMKVFDTPPENHRLIVVATNVAETSLTIPGIKYVVDAGRTKERVFDLANGISSFEVQWISKASADQRAGRAGRTGPGHCYRLYSSAVYDTEFQKFSSPEILCQPIDDLVLQMKAMGIHNVLQFPFPTPPDRQAVKNALATLVNLGAVSPGDDESITGLGRALVKFPVAARFAKMLLLAQKLNVVEYTIAIVAGLSGHSPFIHALDRREKEKSEEENADKKSELEEMEKEWREAEEMRKHAQWIDQESDVLSLLRAAGAYAYTGGSSQFCKDNHLHEKTMQNMLKLRQQLTRIVNKLYSEADAIELKPKMPPPDLETQVVLRQIVAAGFLDQVAKRVPAGTITEGTKIERNCAYIAATGQVKEPVYIHPHSSVFTPNPSKLPQFVVYQHIMRTTRAYMKMVTAIEPEWLAGIGKNTPLCKYAPPLAEPAPFYHAELDEVQCYAKAQYGIHQWALPAMRIAYPDQDASDSKDGLGGKYRWFAKFLLDGQVVTSLLPFSSALKEPSHTLIRKKFDKKIQLLVAKLQQNRVASRRALVDKWRKADGKLFLKAELQSWIKDSHQNAFSQAWGALLKAAVQQDKRKA
ncbi:putative ATP-dependent RNA helicase [Phytophthora cactorum]|uniref:RNA helicase n=2 Tax=Phytophthora cactorum TaxID=29920 RepID=A0A8T1FR37_9STRA|nr:putative ATP-dependent RNA helicase [Phytophthora cactorum]KAG2820255.1 putative ATP-dependent RNA helicase [Phytophthora cactorum]KAG2854395.1 putative ATP-dependent RNA helicase [Phytophthora cactorum]KAG2899888.1 putative ATP-dependent RNA helicase [Phytophthora cactorum]KAG2931322.1 putative ATP-dependent RNA helicase [Phytophthora cactorum]